MTLFLVAGTLQAVAQTRWAVTKTVHIGGDGNWDYVTADSANHRIFVTRVTHALAIDMASGKVLGDMPGMKKAHGVAMVPAAGRGFITDGGGDGAIFIFDLKTYAMLGKIPAMPDSDGILYDPPMNLVLAVSGDGSKLMTFNPDIDPVNGKIDPPIDLDGKPEFLAVDSSGKVYVNLEDKDVLAVVDLHTRKVIDRWPVAPGGHPVGLAFDTKSHRLYVGCRNPQKLIVVSSVDGKVLADMPIGSGVDATAYYGAQAFASARDGSLTVVGEKGGKFEVDQVVKTPLGARTMALDPATRTIYMATAEYADPATASTTPRPAMKPDSFMIVEVAPKAER
jgi:DNA-binding beta-propeller fold protein YncE